MRDRFIFTSKAARELEVNAKSKSDLMEASAMWLKASISAQKMDMIKNMKYCKKRSEYCESYTTFLAVEGKTKNEKV